MMVVHGVTRTLITISFDLRFGGNGCRTRNSCTDQELLQDAGEIALWYSLSLTVGRVSGCCGVCDCSLGAHDVD